MKIFTSYSVRIQGVNAVLDRTVALYREAVDFFIDVMQHHWGQFDGLKQTDAVRLTELLCIKTAKRPLVAHDFAEHFYKFLQISLISSSGSNRGGLRCCYFLPNSACAMES